MFEGRIELPTYEFSAHHSAIELPELLFYIISIFRFKKTIKKFLIIYFTVVSGGT